VQPDQIDRAGHLVTTTRVIYLAIAATIALVLFRSFLPPKTNEVTGTIVAVTESKSDKHAYDVLVAVRDTVVAMKHRGEPRLRKGQEVVLEEVIGSRCRDPLTRHLPPSRARYIECRKRYSLKDPQP
jgi:hypothetical protein